MAFDNLMVFSGNANPRLAQQVARQLNIQLGKANVSKFSDGEIMVSCSRTSAARTSSCCSPRARRPTTT
jgi:phosphoribosylpyrophosphate synthetase